MKLEIDAAGARRAVDVRGAMSMWTVVIDGRTVGLDVASVGAHTSLLIGNGPAAVEIGATRPEDGNAGPAAGMGAGVGGPRASYEVAFEEVREGELIVHVNGYAIPVSIADPRAWRRRRESGSGAGDGPRPLIAPMPGRIVKVLVARGDVVAARQGLVIVEAMKMENELRAPKAGVVTDVRITEGMSIEAQATLMVIE